MAGPPETQHRALPHELAESSASRKHFSFLTLGVDETHFPKGLFAVMQSNAKNKSRSLLRFGDRSGYRKTSQIFGSLQELFLPNVSQAVPFCLFPRFVPFSRLFYLPKVLSPWHISVLFCSHLLHLWPCCPLCLSLGAVLWLLFRAIIVLFLLPSGAV